VGRTAKYSRNLAGGERETRPGDECAEGAFEGENKGFLLVELSAWKRKCPIVPWRERTGARKGFELSAWRSVVFARRRNRGVPGHSRRDRGSW